MALLTAEDVLNKAFSKTKYREGFDQDEVDDFLDEVANTIAALTAERDELQQRLAQASGGGAVAPATGQNATAPPAAVTQSRSETLLQAATDPNPPSATTMLAMAQKLHDEYVQAGEEARDRLIDEGKFKAETIVEQAEKDARARMQDLDTERADLERRIDDLRRFERDYRGHLRNYLENLLGDLEHNASQASAGPVGSSLPEAQSPTTDAPGPDARSDHDAARAFGAGFGVSETSATAPQSPLAALPEAAPPFGDPQGDPNPFGTVEPAPPEPTQFPPPGDPAFPPAQDANDESGDDTADAPRWNF